MEAFDLKKVSPDTRTDQVLDAFKHLITHMSTASGELAILNRWLADLPAHFISGSARVLTPTDSAILTERIKLLSDVHDLYNAEMIILVGHMDDVISSLRLYSKGN